MRLPIRCAIAIAIALAGCEATVAAQGKREAVPQGAVLQSFKPPIIVTAPPPLVAMPTTPIRYGVDVPIGPLRAVTGEPPLNLPIVAQPQLERFYPKALRKAGTVGESALMLQVGEDGRVRACETVHGSGTAELDAAGCALAAKLRFAAPGHGFSGGLPLSVAWRNGAVALVSGEPIHYPEILADAAAIGEDDYPAAALMTESEGYTTAAVLVSAEGKALGCRIAVTSGNWYLDNATCQALMRTHYRPGRDAFGQPATLRFRPRIAWKLPTDVAASPAAAQSHRK